MIISGYVIIKTSRDLIIGMQHVFLQSAGIYGTLLIILAFILFVIVVKKAIKNISL